MSVWRCVRTYRIVVFTIALLLLAGNANLFAEDPPAVTGVYRVFAGTIDGFDVWIVDGKIVREYVIPQFLYGGNPQEYPSIPAREIWIDHAIAGEEYQYTLRHELCERELMADHGWSYGAAHDSALTVEEHLRQHDLKLRHAHERHVPKVGTTDYYGEKEIAALGDSLTLGDIYRVYVGRRDSMDVWIVDGAAVRRDMYPDFGLSGNDLAYHFIPRGEIWLDAQISCEEMEYSIRFELAERALIAGGMQYDDAYEKALIAIRSLRRSESRKAAAMPPVHPEALHASK